MRDNGKRYRQVRAKVEFELTNWEKENTLFALTQTLRQIFTRFCQCSEHLLDNREDEAGAEAAAYDYLRLVGLMGCAWMWVRMVARCPTNDPHYPLRRGLGVFFMQQFAPDADALKSRILSGSVALDNVPAALLADR
ncbi:MAG: acyl-CoA dehydrogenase C-terminal domain-containing protein [Pseudomonadota bacterium]